MKKFSLLQGKLNNEKGITGVDIVVSITLIILSISVIMAVYVNVSNAVNSANRNAGATKIVTSLAEKIELTYYDALQNEFENLVSVGKFKYKPYTIDKVTGKTINAASPATKYAYNGVYTIDHANTPLDFKPFGIKVPKGYNLEIEVQNVINLEEGATEPVGYDLIKEFDITVSYMVSGEKKEVTINVIKAIEKIDKLANNPVFGKLDYIVAKDDSLLSDDTFPKENDINTFKYLKRNLNNFTIIDNLEDYYNNGEPYYIWIDNDNNASTNISGTIEYKDTSPNYKEIYVWVPSYMIDATDSNLYYRYKTTTFRSKKVTKDDILYKNTDSNPTMDIMTIVGKGDFTDTIFPNEDTVYDNSEKVKELEGIWIRLADVKSIAGKSVITRTNYEKYVFEYLTRMSIGF